MMTKLDALAEAQPVRDLYDLLTGDEDARVCRDIPDAACYHQPRNFFVHLVSLTATKTGDQLASARLILPWLLSALGAPALFAGLLVPIRESLALLPQLVIAAQIRRVAVRKWFWVTGSVLQGLCVLGMAFVALTATGAAAGWLIVGLLIAFSLARGICSVASKDVLGKTVSKTRRGRVTGYAASAAGGVTVALGLYSQITPSDALTSEGFLIALLIGAGVAWLVAAGVYALLREQPGATEGGGNAFREAIASVSLLWRDRDLGFFVLTRALFVSTALVAPFYVWLAQEATGGSFAGFGALMIATGLASVISAPIWGRFADRSSRLVLVAAGALAAVTSGTVAVLTRVGLEAQGAQIGFAACYFALGVAHSGVRLGRKTYLVDMANTDNRAAYVAVSNTAIGVLLLTGGLFGVLAESIGPDWVVAVLAALSAVAALMALRLKSVQ